MTNTFYIFSPLSSSHLSSPLLSSLLSSLFSSNTRYERQINNTLAKIQVVIAEANANITVINASASAQARTIVATANAKAFKVIQAAKATSFAHVQVRIISHHNSNATTQTLILEHIILYHIILYHTRVSYHIILEGHHSSLTVVSGDTLDFFGNKL